jgi:hypothetical protein
MAAQTTQLLLPEDLEEPNGITATDLDALRGVSRWLHEFIACPHAQLGRDGTVCPFVPGSLERSVLWFAAEHIADLDTAGVVELMSGYKRFFLEKAPRDDADAFYKTIIVVFPDCSPERAGTLFGEVLGELGDAAYEEDGILFGPFYEGNRGTAIYNDEFRPFQSPTPFLFVRHTVLSDWKFFVDDDTLVERWARRFGPEGAVALAQELRRQPWRKIR